MRAKYISIYTRFTRKLLELPSDLNRSLPMKQLEFGWQQKTFDSKLEPNTGLGCKFDWGQWKFHCSRTRASELVTRSSLVTPTCWPMIERAGVLLDCSNIVSALRLPLFPPDYWQKRQRKMGNKRMLQVAFKGAISNIYPPSLLISSGSRNVDFQPAAGGLKLTEKRREELGLFNFVCGFKWFQ